MSSMTEVIIFILLVFISILVVVTVRCIGRSAELLLENARLFEENQELSSENERLLTEKAIKQNWSIGALKEPNQNSKQ